MQIRRAVTDDSAALTKIANDAKRHWGYPEHWLKHWQDDLTISDDFIASTDVFVAESEGNLLGFYALIIREDKAELDHLWVSPPHIGTGVGKQLFLHDCCWWHRHFDWRHRLHDSSAVRCCARHDCWRYRQS